MNGSVRSSFGPEMDFSEMLEPKQQERTSLTSPQPSPFDFLTVPSTHRRKQIWAIGGGKGGVGKSLVSSNLSIALSRLGHRVVAIDLDLGGANLHTTLGVDLPQQTLSDFFSGRIPTIESCLIPTPIPNLSIISGAQDSTGVTQLSLEHKVKLLQQISELNANYIILDLGAGTSENTLDFFLYADIGIVVLLPEPTSIENAYRFIKSAYYRRLKVSQPLREVTSWIDAAMDAKNSMGIKSPSDLFRAVSEHSPEAAMRLRQEIEKFKPKIVVNQVRTQTDIDIGFSIKTVCKKYFGIDMDYIGYLDYDTAAWQAIRKKRPLMLEFPNSRLVASMEQAAQYLNKRCYGFRTDLY